jgi:hypothetical protein
VQARLFDALSHQHGPVLVGRALDFIGATHEGLAEEEALDLLALASDRSCPPVPRHVVAAPLR